MKQTVSLQLEVELYDLEDYKMAATLAEGEGNAIYTWKTVGLANWLEHGAHQVDALGLVLLPKGLPDIIEMPDDLPDENEESSPF